MVHPPADCAVSDCKMREIIHAHREGRKEGRKEEKRGDSYSININNILNHEHKVIILRFRKVIKKFETGLKLWDTGLHRECAIYSEGDTCHT